MESEEVKLLKQALASAVKERDVLKAVIGNPPKLVNCESYNKGHIDGWNEGYEYAINDMRREIDKVHAIVDEVCQGVKHG